MAIIKNSERVRSTLTADTTATLPGANGFCHSSSTSVNYAAENCIAKFPQGLGFLQNKKRDTFILKKITAKNTELNDEERIRFLKLLGLNSNITKSFANAGNFNNLSKMMSNRTIYGIRYFGKDFNDVNTNEKFREKSKLVGLVCMEQNVGRLDLHISIAPKFINTELTMSALACIELFAKRAELTSVPAIISSNEPAQEESLYYDEVDTYVHLHDDLYAGFVNYLQAQRAK